MDNKIIIMRKLQTLTWEILDNIFNIMNLFVYNAVHFSSLLSLHTQANVKKFWPINYN